MDTKRRRYFVLENNTETRLAHGILYDEGNVQILWRVDIGYTAEQYACLTTVLGCLPHITCLRISDKPYKKNI